MSTTKVSSFQQLAITADLNFNTFKGTNVVDPVSAQDIATKNYVDAVAQGLSPKTSVRAATTATVTLAGSAPNTIDGVTLATNDRILVKNQSTASQNGIYVVTTLGTGSNGTWTRALDMDTWVEVPGASTWVNEGTTFGDTGWVSTADTGGTLNTTAITWTQNSGLGSITAGAGLTKTGNTIDVVSGNVANIVVNADDINLATTGVSGATYGSTGFNVPQYTVDTYGRLTSASNRDMFGSALTAATVFAAPSGATGAPTFRALVAVDIPSLDASKITTGTLAVAQGGTNIASYAIGDLLYGSGATTLSKLADVATGNVLISGGVTTAPLWGKVALTTHVSGILPIANGGTNKSTTPTNGQLLIGNGTDYTIATITQGTGITVTNGVGTITIAATAGLGTANFVTRETPSGTVNGSNVTFTLANTPTSGTETVYVNGVALDSGAGNDYTISGLTITFLSGAIPQTGDKVRVSYMK